MTLPRQSLGPAREVDSITELRASIVRSFIIAQAVEPFAVKEGCTTRHVDSSAGTKLEYFTIAAANSLPSILRLSERVYAARGMPAVTFDILLEAQAASTRYRHGGKVNYAQNLMLFPLIIAQCLNCIRGGDPQDTDLIAEEASALTKRTGVEDVTYFQMFVDLARSQSERHHQRQDTRREQLFFNFLGYGNVYDALGDPGYRNMIMSQEIREAYPLSRDCAAQLIDHDNVGVIRKSEAIYPSLRERLGRHDIAADALVVGLYLALISRPDDVLFL